MKIIMGADKNGYDLKEAVKEYLTDLGHEVTDVGTTDIDNPMPYVEAVPNVAKGIQSGIYDKGILCCGTGMGVSILANKFKGVYAACVETYYGAMKSRAINNANVLTMGGWIIGNKRGCEIAEVFLNTQLGDGLEDFRKELVKKGTAMLTQMEEDLFS